MVKYTSYALCIMIILTVFCSSNRPDPAPAARVGDAVISRGFLAHVLLKMAADRTKQSERETLDRIVANVLVARKAEADGLAAAPGFAALAAAARTAALRDFLCEQHGITDDRDAKLYALVVKTFELSAPAVRWDAIIREERRAPVPLGGAIPRRSRTTDANRDAALDRDAARAVVIVSRVVRSTLLDVLVGLDSDTLDGIIAGSPEERDMRLRAALTDLHLPHLAERLDGPARALLDEVLVRARENLLVETYREHIGFEKLSGGRASRITYPVSPAEAREFYDKNRAQFEEPQRIDVSHIRVRDYAEAERLHKAIVADPSSFCALAAKHSIASDARDCGRIGVIERNAAVKLPLYKEFGFTLQKPGQLSVPFVTPDGVEIVRLNSIEKRLRPFGDPYTQKLIVEQMQPLKREAKLKASIEEMKKKYPVTMH